MAPIIAHMLDDEGKSMPRIPQAMFNVAVAEAANAIPNAVSGIFKFWKSGR